MCQLFVACAVTCPYFETHWHPRLLSCPLARDAARRSSHPSEVHPCGTVTTLWNEDLCPYCLTAKLDRSASKYVRGLLMKYPLKYEPVIPPASDGFGRTAYLMRWAGRAREEFDIEWRMAGRECRRGSRNYESRRERRCYDSGRSMSNEEYLLEKARQRSSSRYYGCTDEPIVEREKETYYTCKPTAERKETFYTCKPTGSRQRYYTSTSPCKTQVYVETAKERRKREKEEDRAYDRYNKERRSSTTTTYRTRGYDIDVDVDVDVKEKKRDKKKSVSFSDDKYYYGYY